MLKVIFTLDYEIHGNGDGSPRDLMIEPTRRLLRLCEERGARVTIMADVAEILKFREYKEQMGRDEYSYDALADQLRDAVRRGHDVQLHIHSSYFNARHEEGRWVQDWSEYDFARLPYERMHWMIARGKEFLETLLRPVDPGYRCIAFRAANWSVSPSRNVVRALVSNDIAFDTSVFKYGARQGMVNFDYSRAYSPIVPWRVREDDICLRDDGSPLWELPIYAERRWIGAFLTANRIRRVVTGLRHRLDRKSGRAVPAERGSGDAAGNGRGAWAAAVLQKHAWKADFNQCEGRQLAKALERAARTHDHGDAVLPFVLIGHSKLFGRSNERSLAVFLDHVAGNPGRYGFCTLSGMERSPGSPAATAAERGRS